jgi:hypothetical protein
MAPPEVILQSDFSRVVNGLYQGTPSGVPLASKKPGFSRWGFASWTKQPSAL